MGKKELGTGDEDNSRRKKLDRREIIRRLRQEALGEASSLLVGSLAMMASSLANQAFPRLMGRLIDQTSTGSSTTLAAASPRQFLLSPPTSTSFWSFTSSLGLVVLGGGLASFLRTTSLRWAEIRIASRLRRQAFESLMTDLDLEWFQTEDLHPDSSNDDQQQHDPDRKAQPKSVGVTPATIGTILQEDVAQIASVLTTTLANVLRSSSAVCFSVYHMFMLNSSLLAVSATVIPLVGAAAMILRKSIKRINQRQEEMATCIASFVEERLLHLALVKMSNRENDEIQAYHQWQEESVRLGTSAAVQNGLFMGFVFAASSGALLGVVHSGGRAVSMGKMTSGQLTSFATYSFLLGLGTSGVVKALSEMMQGLGAADRFYRLLDSSSASSSTAVSTASVHDQLAIDPAEIQSIAFQDVRFGYKSTQKVVLKNLSFELKAGHMLALVGKNGSGKSTIAALLAGLYQPWQGRIVLSDGTDLCRLDKESRKKMVQILPQSPALFNMSILENVRYSRPDATDQEVLAALRAANCDGLLARLEGGVHFVIGLNGCKLSGGERQRLALARAILADPWLLVMDEPAASLDVEGENAVTEALAAWRREAHDGPGRAMLLITHHSKSLALADLVLVLKEGELVEVGTLSELQKNPRSELCGLMPDLL